MSRGNAELVVLPGGRVLVAENQAQRVTERDLKGNILWQKQILQNPIACQRLPNGNTFIATYQSVMEVTRTGKEVYAYNHGPNFFIFGAHKLRNGHILCISAQGAIIELDAAGKEIKSTQVTNSGGWCGVEGLPGGHILVAVTSNNKVVELDATGKEIWRCTTVQGPCSATRLPNGNTLVASMANQRVVEVDRLGKTVWEQRTDGRPFRAHRR
jgi:outer membrane protein assembly factor BamB